MDFDFKAWLERNGLTVAEYAELVGLSQHTIYRRTRGLQRCGVSRELAILLKIAERVSVREMMKSMGRELDAEKREE